MNRLETINKDLSEKIDRSTNETILNRINLNTCDFAINEGNLSDNKIVEEINSKLQNKEVISDDDIQTISDLMERHDELYFDYDDNGQGEEAMIEFGKTRALASLLYALQYYNTTNIDLLKESIYEASMINEDNSDFFNTLQNMIE
ncbi:hypothetical protein [Sphingobacterium sp. DR205]|uniref:hypothetical protein n=1 Tax=Sphingobacterium sp. DR205 TaxID=2713573 RepID=UPI0013E4FFE5|nr:hypothetical protein [Sphingobacterium sp. DR205]QIH34542.1 hypothetical protein G6053_17305 [Sphingobacterium sp. DR205]